ncbi:MAG: hypothetical protein ABI891_11470 [Acidobacteriota bacterium]
MKLLEIVQTDIVFSSLLKRYTLEEFWVLTGLFPFRQRRTFAKSK